MLIALLLAGACSERNHQIMSRDAFEKYLRFLVRRAYTKAVAMDNDAKAQRDTMLQILSRPRGRNAQPVQAQAQPAWAQKQG